MILFIRHKGLRRLFENDDPSGVRADQVGRLIRILTLLNRLQAPQQAIHLPGMRVHPLKGELKGFWSITVSGNWRVIFKMDKSDVTDVDLVDYH